MHPTCGILRHFQAFSWLRAFPTPRANPHSAHTRVTQTVGRLLQIIWENMKLINIVIVFPLLIMSLTSCSAFAPKPTEAPTPTGTVLPISSNTFEPTVTPTKTPIPLFTKTEIPATFVSTQDGKRLINNQYGFTITLPSNIDILNFNSTDDKFISTQLPTKNLSDGGQIFINFDIWVENQTDSCHEELPKSFSNVVKMEQVTLGGTLFSKVYTPNLEKNELQAIEYMTYGTDFCVHLFTGLFMYYFDRGDATPGNMLPYVQDEIDGIISTFQWVRK
jgi:hypothetical protein